MIPKKIEKKIQEVCDDAKMRDLLLDLLKYEDSGKGRYKQYYKSAIEKYAKETEK